MTVFDYINSVAFTKKDIMTNCGDESQFVPFMMNRWLSFYSPEVAELVNFALNKQLKITQKKDVYKLYLNVVPKLRYKRINYIKKVKKEKEKLEDKVIVPDFMSKREYNMYVDLLES